ncbi:MAG: two-component regulator propeller domain-containing protein [Thermoanaerobaculia bacterium]
MRSIVLPVVLGSLLGVLLPDAALALDRERSLAELHHTAWTAKDGAPSQIGALAQTRDGYLWIASSRGLFRFDGVQFEAYRPQEGARLPTSSFELLAATPDGGLWVSFRTGSLGYLKDGRITVYSRPGEIPPAWVSVLACGRDGRVWAGTQHGLFLRDGAQWKPVGRELAPSRVRCLFVDRQGTLWMGSDDGVFSLPQGASSLRKSGWNRGIVRWLLQAPDGRIWVADDDGVQPLLPDPGKDGGGAEEFRADTPLATVFDREGALWFAVHRGGLRRVRFPEKNGAVESFHERNGLSSESASCVIEDREGNIWVSTARGIDRFSRSRVVAVRVPPGHTGFTLIAGEGGEVWAGSEPEMPLLRIRGEEPHAAGVPIGAVSVHRDQEGTVWWGGHGIWRQRGSTLEAFPQPGAAWAMFRSESGGLWVSIGDEQEVMHFQDGAWTHRALPEGVLPRHFQAAYEDPSGRTWLGYSDDQAVVLNGGSSRHFTKADGLDVGRIKVIRGPGPHMWFGGELGLALFREGRFHTIRTSGIELGTVSGIIETKGGDVWLNEIHGIVHIAAAEVRALLADPRRAAAIEVLDHRDGLPGAPQMTGSNSTAVEASDGRLWFATDNGLARIDPVAPRKNPVPPDMAIRSLSADGKSYDLRTPPRLPPRTASLQIEYTALSLSMPSRVIFRYRLEGLDRGWQEAGNRRTAIYTNPPPGTYRFRVVACNEDGIWNEQGASLELAIAPTFAQTPAFIVLCIATSLALAFGVYRLRVNEVKSRLDIRFRERLAERTRIARDLHDTLLQGVLSASMQLRIAADQMRADSAVKPRLDRVLELMDIVGAEGRNALQGLRARLSDLDDLENAFSRIRHELDASEDIVFRVFGEGQPVPLLSIARDGIYRIGREAVVNAFRHSRAKRIEVELRFQGDAVTLLVRDDGCGIAPGVLRSGRPGHWGLSGMRERAEEMGAILTVRTRDGAGTEVELRIPALTALRPRDEGARGSRRGWRASRTKDPVAASPPT